MLARLKLCPGEMLHNYYGRGISDLHLECPVESECY